MISDEQFLAAMHITRDIKPEFPQPAPMRPTVACSQIAVRIEDGEATMSSLDFCQLLTANTDLNARLEAAERLARRWRRFVFIAAVNLLLLLWMVVRR